MLKTEDFKISFRFNDELPYNEGTLVDLLLKNGFKKKNRKPNTISIDPFTGLQIEEVLLRKGKITITSQNSRGVLGVEAKTTKIGIKGISLLIDLINKNKKVQVTIDEDVKFLEVIFAGIWYSNLNWYPVFQRYYCEKYGIFQNFYDEDIQSYALRLSSVIPVESPTKKIVEFPNFFELQLAPLSKNPKRVKVVHIYRNSDIQKVIEFNDDLEKKLSKLLRNMEE